MNTCFYFNEVLSFDNYCIINPISGARVLLLADVFVIGMLVSIVVWLFAVIVVILTCSSCIEGLGKQFVESICAVV